MVIAVDNIEVAKTLNPPDLTQLTTKALDGTGAFDVLMKVVKLHLMDEYNSNRITGEEYSRVYLGALQATLQQSLQFLVNHQLEEKTIAEIGLVRQKTVTELAQTDNTLPLGLGFNGDSAIEGIVEQQKDLLAQQILEAEKGVIIADNNAQLIEQKVVTELAQTDTEIPVGLGHNNTTVVDGLIKSQREKTDAEKLFTDQKIVTEITQVNDTLPAGLGSQTSTVISGLVDSQKTKMASETQLLNQKSVTELAQTYETIPADSGSIVPTSYPVEGLSGKQIGLFTAQTDGFARDAEQKASKIIVDTWNVRRTTDETGTIADNINKLEDSSIGSIMTKLAAGIDVVL